MKIMSILAKQARPKKPPAAAASHGRSSRNAASSANRPATTKNCANVSGTGYFANQICGRAAVASRAASSPVRTPPRCAATRNRPPTLSTPNSGATKSAPRGGDTCWNSAARTGNSGENPLVTTGSAISGIVNPPGNRAYRPYP